MTDVTVLMVKWFNSGPKCKNTDVDTPKSSFKGFLLSENEDLIVFKNDVFFILYVGGLVNSFITFLLATYSVLNAGIER